MNAWTRSMALGLLVFAGSLLALPAEDQTPEPAQINLTLYHIQGSKTDKPVIAEAIQFLKKIFAAFPQFNSFALLDSPSAVLTKTGPQNFNTGKFTTTVTLKSFTLARDTADHMVWKADLKIDCTLDGAVIHSPTVRIEPGGQHTWERDGHIFVLQSVVK
ncbi:MAG TPA: hypothetical protein VL860_02405 [Planctomycetota bacterium]|nr:hypothetical protein [Planctomycetota bacterium]